MYGDAFLARAAERHGAYDTNLMATLTEFTARAVAIGLQQCVLFGPPVDNIMMAGGGVNNPVLIERIAALISPIPIRMADDLGIPHAAREAMVFAVLADMTLRGTTACLPLSPGQPQPSCSVSSHFREVALFTLKFERDLQ